MTRPTLHLCLIPLLLSLSSVSGPAQANETNQVTMTLSEFLDMWEENWKLTHKDPEDPTPPPEEVSMATASYTGTVLVRDGEPVSAVFDATFHIEVLKTEGWVRIPILPATVAVREAHIGKERAALVLRNGWYQLITDRHGGFDLMVDFAASVNNASGQSSFAFEIPPSGATQATLSVPAKDALDFEIPGSRLVETHVKGDLRVVDVVLPATGSLAMSWQRAIPDVEVEEARIYAESYHLIGLGDGLIQTSSTIAYTILQAPVRQFTLSVPSGATVVDVTGAGIRSWASDAGRLLVNLNYGAEGAYSLRVQVEQAMTEGAIAPSLVAPEGIDRAKGWVGVEARGNLEVQMGDGQTDATPVDVRTLPATILGQTNQPVLLGFKYLGASIALPLAIDQHEDVDVLVTLIDQAIATTLFTTDGRRLTRVVYKARNNRKQFLRLQLPEGATVWSTLVGGRAVQPARSSDGRVLIPLVRSQTAAGELSAFDIEIVYVEDGEAPIGGKGNFQAHLPLADVPTTYVGWTVYAPHQARIARKDGEGSLRRVDWLSSPYYQDEIAYMEATTGAAQMQVVTSANAMSGTGGLDRGTAPVQVNLPLDGQALFFEKLLALGEDLWVGFHYKGLDRD